MRLVQYLKEGRTIGLTYEEFMKELLKYSHILKYYKGGGNVIYRGGVNEGGYAIIKPSEHEERRSAYTSNYYNIIVSNDPTWKHIPKRSKSVVCTTDYSYADGYNDKVYVVLPKNGSNVAFGISQDFWDSFPDVFGTNEMPLGDFNDTLWEIFKFIGVGDSDDSLQKLRSACGRFDDMCKSDYNGSWNDMIETGVDWGDLSSYFRNYRRIIGDHYKGDLYKALVEIFNPRYIEVVKSGKNIRNGVEVWTDGDCLLIDYLGIWDDNKDTIMDAI